MILNDSRHWNAYSHKRYKIWAISAPKPVNPCDIFETLNLTTVAMTWLSWFLFLSEASKTWPILTIKLENLDIKNTRSWRSVRTSWRGTTDCPWLWISAPARIAGVGVYLTSWEVQQNQGTFDFDRSPLAESQGQNEKNDTNLPKQSKTFKTCFGDKRQWGQHLMPRCKQAESSKFYVAMKAIKIPNEHKRGTSTSEVWLLVLVLIP